MFKGGSFMFYDYKLVDRKGKEVDLKDYENKVVLIVNSATECGFTPHYEDLQKLYEKYSAKGLEILDIPCNQFGNQAPGTDDEIHEFCQVRYNTKFPQMKKADVNGENELPLYTFLKEKQGFKGFDDHKLKGVLEEILAKNDPDWAKSSDIKWNFTKFVVDKKGDVVARFEPTADFSSIEKFIVSLL